MVSAVNPAPHTNGVHSSKATLNANWAAVKAELETLQDAASALFDASGTGKILRADGTDWAPSTATWPDTTTGGQLLYSSANNVVAGLPTAASGVLVTNLAGVPEIVSLSALAALLNYPRVAFYSGTIDFNAVGDYPIVISCPTTRYRIASGLVVNRGTTASLTTAQYGIFSDVGGGGDTIVAAGTSLAGITSNALNTNAALAGMPATNFSTKISNYTELYFRVTQAQGAEASGFAYLNIEPIPDDLP